MPLGPITIETGDAMPGTFTYTAVNGTSPYTYDITFSGIGGSGIVGNISGGESNVVTFDATLARAGSYVIEIRGKVTDTPGQVDQDGTDDIEYYTVTVNPIVAIWIVG